MRANAAPAAPATDRRRRPQFDKSILRAFEERVNSKASFKGQLDVYRFCDSVSIGPDAPAPVLRNARTTWC